MADRYFLLGENVSNSPSPRMMNAAFEALGMDSVYQALNVGAANLRAVLAELERSGTKGANVTLPHKTSIVPLLGSLDEVSSRIGAVNTLMGEGGSFSGYNTDVAGILNPLRSRGISKIRRAFVIGTGGAARAFCEAAHVLECRELAILSRDPGRTAGFLQSMGGAFPEIEIEFAPASGLPPWKPELVFNASPAGVNGIPLSPQVPRLLEGGPVVFDAVYSPVETDLVRLAQGLGCPVVYGHEMLLQQGMKSLEIWSGRPPPLPVMKAALFGFLG